MLDFHVLLMAEAAFSDEAFGKNRSFTGPLNHLKSEIDEVLAEATTRQHSSHDLVQLMPDEKDEKSLAEFADCQLLLLDAFHKCHPDLTGYQLLQAAFNKIEINKRRQWGKPDANGVFLHIKKHDEREAMPGDNYDVVVGE